MAKATKEQENAINASGKNIIVSAGAGSGKTFVLKSRVKKIVTSGTKVDELIILTFTNAAAQEMKDRIRKVIKETVTEENKDELDLVESAYITTFDSFAQSIVKKYNYLLNIDKHFTIIVTLCQQKISRFPTKSRKSLRSKERRLLSCFQPPFPKGGGLAARRGRRRGRLIRAMRCTLPPPDSQTKPIGKVEVLTKSASDWLTVPMQQRSKSGFIRDWLSATVGIVSNCLSESNTFSLT